jgi:hypothetical protein
MLCVFNTQGPSGFPICQSLVIAAFKHEQTKGHCLWSIKSGSLCSRSTVGTLCGHGVNYPLTPLAFLLCQKHANKSCFQILF